MDMNVWSGTGRLGRDPEMREVGSDTVCNLSLAVSGYKDATNWLRVTVWGKGAAACNEYLHSGSRIAVTGELQIREWTDKDNNKRTSVEIRAAMFGGVTFLDRKGEKADDVPRADQDDGVPF